MSLNVPNPMNPMIPRTLFGPEHEDFRRTARRFFEEEMAPHREKWEAQQHIDRHLWNKAGELGLLCATMPEEYGGSGVDRLYSVIMMDHGIWDIDALYDLETDPHERHNLISVPAYAERAQQLRAQLFRELDASGALDIPVRVPAGERLDQRKLP